MQRLFSASAAADGAIGSRWVDGSKLTVRQGLLRRLESRGFNLLIRVLFGLSYNDTQCGAKVFKRAAVDAVLPAMVSRGFEFDVELLWRLKRAGYPGHRGPDRMAEPGRLPGREEGHDPDALGSFKGQVQRGMTMRPILP